MIGIPPKDSMDTPTQRHVDAAHNLLKSAASSDELPLNRADQKTLAEPPVSPTSSGETRARRNRKLHPCEPHVIPDTPSTDIDMHAAHDSMDGKAATLALVHDSMDGMTTPLQAVQRMGSWPGAESIGTETPVVNHQPKSWCQDLSLIHI